MIPQFSWPRPRFKAYRSTTNVLHCMASGFSFCYWQWLQLWRLPYLLTYSLACRLRLALDIPDLSSTRALETWLDMKWTIYPYFLSQLLSSTTSPPVARPSMQDCEIVPVRSESSHQGTKYLSVQSWKSSRGGILEISETKFLAKKGKH